LIVCASKKRRWVRAFTGTTMMLFVAVMTVQPRPANATSPAESAASSGTHFPHSVSQGALVIGKVTPGSKVRYTDRDLLVSANGEVVFGVGRDETGPVSVDVRERDGHRDHVEIAVAPRDWPVERIEGVPPETVEPPPDIAERIKREQARVVAARMRNDARDDFLAAFTWPVEGRISGRFGSQRVYVVKGKDVPKSPHPGMDIAVPQGTPVKAPAAGIVTFADPSLYLTGGTVLIDHGQGVSSNFLHMSRVDVKVGERIEQGQIIGAVGMTGRATGPHLHWGMNWFDVRLDPLLLMEPSG
jgi:biotin carboxyl carrier protein